MSDDPKSNLEIDDMVVDTSHCKLCNISKINLFEMAIQKIQTGGILYPGAVFPLRRIPEGSLKVARSRYTNFDGSIQM